VIVVVSGFCNSGGRPEHGSVPSRIRLGQRGIDWTKLVVGVARRSGVHEYDSACCDTARGACARSRGIESCHSGNSARVRNAARRSRDDSGPKHHAQAANRRFATWLTLGTDTERCIQRRRPNGVVEQHVVSVYTIEQWRGSSSSRNRTAELDEQGTRAGPPSSLTFDEISTKRPHSSQNASTTKGGAAAYLQLQASWALTFSPKGP
jgi:hypothetical protein